MLLRLHKLAQKLAFFRPLSVIISVVSLLLSIYCLIIDSTFTAGALEPSIISALWSLLLFAFLQLFQSIPAPVLPHDRFIEKVATRIKLALYSLLALVVVFVSFLLFWMSIRLVLL